jgi:hypothetical protein
MLIQIGPDPATLIPRNISVSNLNGDGPVVAFCRLFFEAILCRVAVVLAVLHVGGRNFALMVCSNNALRIAHSRVVENL